MVGK
jgi:hypothetical protein